MALPSSANLVSALHLLPAGDVQGSAPLATWCSVRTGGPAEALVRPKSIDMLVAVLRFARKENVPVSILGGGANTLVGDRGVPGITLKLPSDFTPELLDREQRRVTLGAGAPIARLVTVMKLQRWVGAEFLAGIPGTLGGAVTMNAGTKHGECMRIVSAVELATAEGAGWVEARELPFRYRHTELPEGAVITRVRFQLAEGDLAASQAQMDSDLQYRKRTQPLSQPNFGSVFTNPPGDHAGRLIEAVGLKGHTVGRAQISTLHANWIVNLGGASSADIVSLMELAAQRVFELHRVQLTPEVRRLGRFS